MHKTKKDGHGNEAGKASSMPNLAAKVVSWCLGAWVLTE